MIVLVVFETAKACILIGTEECIYVLFRTKGSASRVP